MNFIGNYSAYSSFTPYLRCFRTQSVTYFYMRPLSVRKRLDMKQNINTLSSYLYCLSIR
ncbi:hypothetical protein MNBD_GAMMA16-1567 [hydrothermal vent metagenome]|uniref:Uncharacterized protein n=1 Tax=hydrothermal vent metagenome TaxID=652676 RepID=A0A3B0Z9P1_9ZZZZ